MPLDEQRARRALERFMRELGLEARLPNSTIMALSELILIDKANFLNKEQREYLTNIHQNSIKLQKVLEYLFKMVCVFYGGVNLSVEEVNLDQFIPQIMAATRDHWLTQPYSINSGLIEQHIPEKLPAVWVDGQWVQQAIIGLLSEVMGASYGNRTKQKILLTVSHDETSVRFNISTLGEYRRYFDEESPRLFLAQAIAEQHGGELEIRNTEILLEIILTLPISKNKPVSGQ